MKLIGQYMNGDTKVRIFDDGTKIRETEADDFHPAFAENCDCKLTSVCDAGCQFCYEGCTKDGLHGRTDYEFLNHLHPYTEMAINGNDLTHPDLIPFLQKLKEQRVIANMTVNQIHFEREFGLITQLVNAKLITGIGISLREPTKEFIEKVQKFPNAVIHTINGVHTKKDYEALMDNNLKVLILGYKNLQRGKTYLASHTEEVSGNQKWLYDNIERLLPHYNVVSFDNLALEQLQIKRLLSEEEWEEFYMGDDGSFTFYIDLVAGTFSKNSMSPLEQRYPIEDFTIDEMFDVIRKESGYIKEI